MATAESGKGSSSRNPFAEEETEGEPADGSSGGTHNAPNPFDLSSSAAPTAANPFSNAASKTAGTNASTSDANASKASELDRRAQQLDQKEQWLNKRERELDQRERQLSSQNQGRSRKDWPSKRLRLARHNIQEDIPPQQRRAVWFTYFLWMIFAMTVLFNLVCVLANSKQSSFESIVFALIFVCLGIPLAWMLWHKRLYNALKNGSSFSFLFFFVFFGLHMLFCALGAVAPPFSKSARNVFAGWINGIDMISGDPDENTASYNVAVMYLVSAAIFTINAALAVPVYGIAIKTYRMKGHSIQQARREIRDGPGTSASKGSEADGHERV